MTQTGKYFLRILCMALCLACAFSLAQPAAAVMEQVPGTEKLASTSKVYYRASRYSMVIGQIEDGTTLKVLKETDDFYRIDCSGMSGYISKMQVTRNEYGVYTVSCAAEDEDTGIQRYAPWIAGLQKRGDVVQLAKTQLGTRYVYGGTSPYGFDCSGFTQYIYGKYNVRLNRCADTQLENGIIVERKDLQMGDLVFFRTPGSPWVASHVGIYVGNDQMLHASRYGIAYADLGTAYWTRAYVGARRIIPVAADETLPISVPAVTNEAVTPPATQQTVTTRAAN